MLHFVRRKRCAAGVMILWLAMMISFWGMSAAGKRGQVAAGCDPGEITGRSAELILASSAAEVREILDPPAKDAIAPCIRATARAMVKADHLFIAGYSTLVFAMFLFVRALRQSTSGILPIAGLLLVVTAATADVLENQSLLGLIGTVAHKQEILPGDLEALKWRALVKTYALAGAGIVLAISWRTIKKAAWPIRAHRILGIAAAALAILAIPMGRAELYTASFILGGLFWLTSMIHAVAIAAYLGPECDH